MFRGTTLVHCLKKYETKVNVSLKLEARECGFKLRFGNLVKFRGLNTVNQKNINLFASVCTVSPL